MSQSLLLDVPVDLIKDPRAWTVEDIGVWLLWLGIGEHAEAFAARGVDGRILLQLSAESAWADLGVTDSAQQRVLDSAVEPLRCFQDAEGAESGLALHAIEGPVAGEVFFVGAGGVTGGRHCASNGIVLSENYVSRRHFQITRDRAGHHLLQDVGSTTGTFLMVREELPLDHQTIVQLGTTELTVGLDGDVCTLVATEGPDKDASAVVPPQGLFIGREATNGLCIRDPQISAFHCEVRPVPDEGGYILDDKYSTNRTWLRLAPDGQPSKRYVLRIGDLFKVGSTLFHVVEPPSVATAVEATAASGGMLDRTRSSVPASLPPGSDNGSDGSLGDEEYEEDVSGPLQGSLASPASASAIGRSPSESGLPPAVTVNQLHWEPFLEGEARPVLSPEEYARRVTASRRRMHAEGSARRASNGHGGDGHASQESGLFDLRERELSSLQQRMRNSRAQAAYTLQEQRSENRRDEDVCKICYDNDIDVVLYPCGHFILCRWCAHKVSDCPVCRFVITDVIRTYKA